MRRRIAAAAGACLAAVLVSGVLAGPAAAQWFSPSSFWNTPLAPTAKLDARSATWVRHLQSKVAVYGQWINTTHYSTPVYTVPANQPAHSVWIDTYPGQYQSDFYWVPVPNGAQASPDTDHHIVIWQPATDTYWEFWNFYVAPDGYHALAGARITNASQSNGIVPNVTGADFPSPYGATATGLPIVGGLITPAELQQGSINHVVQIAIPHPLWKTYFSWPAQRSDGDSIDPCDIPEGVRFRLPPSLNVGALGLSPVASTIARAVQKYGLVVSDKGGAVVFVAQQPLPGTPNPYPALFGGQSPDQVLAGFPWSKLQALKSQSNRGSWPAATC